MPPRPKIERLPPAVRRWIERALIDRTHGTYEALEQALKEKGYQISDTALWKYDQRLQRVMERIRASTEAARLIAAEMPDAKDDLSQTLLRMVQSEMFDIMVKLREAAEEGTLDERLKAISAAIRAAADSARASAAHRRWQEEVKEKLDAAEAEAEKRGKRLDPETLKAVREALYGG